MVGQKKVEPFSFSDTVRLTEAVGAKVIKRARDDVVPKTEIYRKAIDQFFGNPPERLLPEDTVRELVRSVVNEELATLRAEIGETSKKLDSILQVLGGFSVKRQESKAQNSEDASTKSEGLVSNLLPKAAGQEQNGKATIAANQTPVRNPQELDGLFTSQSVYLARAIDHDAFIEIWQQHQNGERGVFTRRMYTLEGQKTFNEILTKYRRDPEFKTSANRYVKDFDRLMADVAKNDKDRTKTLEYITSDAGKVYIMLAHASGRFGEIKD